VKVEAPDGTTWKVGRQWFPDRKLELDAGGLDFPGIDGLDDAFAIIGVVLLVIALAILLFTVIFPLLEIALIVVLAVLGVAGRVLFRRPWTVRARSKDRATIRRQVVGWRDSGELRDRLAAAIRDGSPLPL
jgi:hypothetical protein